MNAFLNAAKGFFSRGTVPPIALEQVEHGLLGPEGPGMFLHLSATIKRPLPDKPTMTLRVSQKGLRIASWEAAYADQDGTFKFSGTCTFDGLKATCLVWLPYSSIPAMVEGELEFHSFLHGRNSALCAEGRHIIQLPSYEERMRASGLGALVDFIVHTLRPLGHVTPAGAEYLRCELADMFELSPSGIQTVNALIRMATTSAQPEWKTLWHMEQFFKEVHHEFILNLVVKTVQMCRYSLADVQPILTELASILRIDQQKVLKATTPFTLSLSKGGVWGQSYTCSY